MSKIDARQPRTSHAVLKIAEIGCIFYYTMLVDHAVQEIKTSVEVTVPGSITAGDSALF